MKRLNESLIKASNLLCLSRSNLQLALEQAQPIEALTLLGMISEAKGLEHKVDLLIDAIQSSQAGASSNEIHIELKMHDLDLDELVNAVNAYGDDIDYGHHNALVDALKIQAGCTCVSLSRDDWITVAASMRLTNDHSSAATIDKLIDCA